ncbi:UDP-N-acetylmuramoyl-L-alanine--D-glutamate ligase [soil metagenome]
MSARTPSAGTTPVAVTGARVGVLGLARSGVPVARLLAASGADVYASDLSPADDVRAAARILSAEGIDAEAGRHDRERLAACDWIVTSPGIPPSSQVLRDPAVAALPVYDELEVASWFARAPIAAVTGTNGKTTTTELLGSIARGAGVSASVAGNLGRAFSTAVLEDPEADWYVLEVSSFQLGRIATFRPRVAVVLNLTPDHLDRYPDMDAYARDKARIAENQGAGDDLCLSAEEAALRGFGEGRPVRRHWFHRSMPVERGAWISDGWIRVVGEPSEGRVLAVDSLRIPGSHNVQNALAAALAATLMGIDREAIAEALGAFRGVPHRLETIVVRDGVTWVNDSKATNVDSTAVALAAFDRPLIVILGGRHAGGSYSALGPLLATRARRVLAIGEAAEQIAAELAGSAPVEIVGTLAQAVEVARALARPGEVVLLSPACKSYDQFRNFEERGERFRSLAGGEAMAEQGAAR